MAYTPGPWKVGRGADANKIVADGNPPTLVAEMWYRSERFDNANLIAAAPDLLAACEAAAETFDDDAPGPGLTEREALKKLKSAIARARGREG